VDTGGIITCKTIEITKGDTIESLGKKADRLAGELMAETVLRIVEGEHIQAIPQSKEDGKQHYRMPASLFKQAKRKLWELRS
jgi:methionyl-tRNA formyltransferase